MDGLKRILGSGPSYVGLYLLLMLPTYILPYFGSNSLLVNAAVAAADSANPDVSGLNLLLFVHLACLGGLALLAWLRGSIIGKTWIVALPIIAAVFDIVPGLSLIPLVPTALHITAIVVGVSGTPVEAAQGAPVVHEAPPAVQETPVQPEAEAPAEKKEE